MQGTFEELTVPWPELVLTERLSQKPLLRAYTSDFGAYLALCFQSYGQSRFETEICRNPVIVPDGLSDYELFMQHCVVDGWICGDPWPDVAWLVVQVVARVSEAQLASVLNYLLASRKVQRGLSGHWESLLHLRYSGDLAVGVCLWTVDLMWAPSCSCLPGAMAKQTIPDAELQERLEALLEFGKRLEAANPELFEGFREQHPEVEDEHDTASDAALLLRLGVLEDRDEEASEADPEGPEDLAEGEGDGDGDSSAGESWTSWHADVGPICSPATCLSRTCSWVFCLWASEVGPSKTPSPLLPVEAGDSPRGSHGTLSAETLIMGEVGQQRTGSGENREAWADSLCFQLLSQAALASGASSSADAEDGTSSTRSSESGSGSYHREAGVSRLLVCSCVCCSGLCKVPAFLHAAAAPMCCIAGLLALLCMLLGISGISPPLPTPTTLCLHVPRSI